MSATDAMLSRLQAELEEKRTFMDGLVEAAEAAGRDMTAEEIGLYQRSRDRMAELDKQMEPLREGAKIAVESRRRGAEIAEIYRQARSPQETSAVEYRTAGSYVADLYLSHLGDNSAADRLDVYHRVAAHQTTTDNPGLLPERIVAPIVEYVDVSRPLVSAIGPMDLGSGAWAYARVTQHTQVGLQAGEKTELASRKMLITKTPLGADTYGGYVNVSKQDINRTSPAILDMVINDLAGQYAIATEAAAATALFAAATAGTDIPTSVGTTPSALELANSIYGAVGSVYAAVKGQGRVIIAVSPDRLGMIAPLFPNINPQNAYGSGFTAAGVAQGQGAQGMISGLTVIMTAGLAAGSIVVFSTAAVKAFEYRYGALQVVEPSVWGVQVGYAGDFDFVAVEAAGIIKLGVAA